MSLGPCISTTRSSIVSIPQVIVNEDEEEKGGVTVGRGEAVGRGDIEGCMVGDSVGTK